jgi:outer membrane autotransporter protein
VRTTTTLVQSLHTAIDNAIHDVKGNGNDPFLRVFGFTGKDKLKDDGRDKFHGCGVVGGLDFVAETKNGALLKYGALCSFARGKDKATFSGTPTRGSNHTQDMVFGGVFGAYESFNDRNLKTDGSVIVGFGHSKNKLRRTAGDDTFNARFNGDNFSATGEFIKNMWHLKDGQIGPWLSLAYHRVHQKGYTESGNGATAHTVAATTASLLDLTLGFNYEREIQSQTNADRRLRLFARLGWNHNPVVKYSGGNFLVGGTGDSTSLTFDRRKRHHAVLTGGLRYKLNKHVDLTGTLFGKFGKRSHYLAITGGVGYTF